MTDEHLLVLAVKSLKDVCFPPSTTDNISNLYTQTRVEIIFILSNHREYIHMTFCANR